MDLYNFNECGADRKQCQAGFFLVKNNSQPLACCPGYFCPAGQVCMILCRPGSYCPSPLQANDGICQTPVVCPEHQRTDFEYYGCGGSTFEGFCPAKSYCSSPSESMLCLNRTSYCPTGVIEPLSCLAQFNCTNGRAHEGHLIVTVPTLVVVFIILFVVCAKIFQYTDLKKKISRDRTSLTAVGTSDYFKEHDASNNTRPQFQLNIQLYRARLRDVTRFDFKQNRGFTGRIVAGRITALMGGSGCGKSSLLETIHGRRRLLDGSITFAEHEPLSNVLSDYIGYVPQNDVMHDDLTVFETVYYSARTRRLGDWKKIIRNDVRFVLDKLGLKNMHNSMTKTLSGGKKNHY
jgi:hypothetical protein